MEVLVRNAEGNLNSRDREYAAKKLGGLNRFFHSAAKVEMVHREEKYGQHLVEITIFADGFTIRGRESEETVAAAIDKVKDKLEARLLKLKGRILKSHRRRGTAPPPAFEAPVLDENDNHAIEIKERKSFLIKPMSVDEAALALELIDHSFYVFRSEDTGKFAVLFRRKDGKYGLIEPED